MTLQCIWGDSKVELWALQPLLTAWLPTLNRHWFKTTRAFVCLTWADMKMTRVMRFTEINARGQAHVFLTALLSQSLPRSKALRSICYAFYLGLTWRRPALCIHREEPKLSINTVPPPFSLTDLPFDLVTLAYMWVVPSIERISHSAQYIKFQFNFKNVLDNLY